MELEDEEKEPRFYDILIEATETFESLSDGQQDGSAAVLDALHTSLDVDMKGRLPPDLCGALERVLMALSRNDFVLLQAVRLLADTSRQCAYIGFTEVVSGKLCD